MKTPNNTWQDVMAYVLNEITSVAVQNSKLVTYSVEDYEQGTIENYGFQAEDARYTVSIHRSKSSLPSV